MSRPEGPVGLDALCDRYDALICDLWGVLHDGVAAFAEPCAALQRARAAGLTVLVLTNAPKPEQVIAARMTALGVPEDAWDGVLSSGGLVQRALARDYADMPAYLVGVSADRSLVEHHPVADTLDAAALLVVAGLMAGQEEDAKAHDPLLAAARSRALPFLCANADRWVPMAGRPMPCAGLLADRYLALGGQVRWFGKPFADTYDEARRLLAHLRGAPVPDHRILAIGDGLATDIAGAAAAGLDSLWISRGLHTADVEAAGGPLPFLEAQSCRPRFHAPLLS